MIYSNRIIKDGKVKLPRYDGILWAIRSSCNGDTWLELSTLEGVHSVVPLKNNGSVSEKTHYRKVENAGMSLFSGFMDDRFDEVVDPVEWVEDSAEIIPFPVRVWS